MNDKTNPQKAETNSLVRGLLVLECFNPRKDRFTLSELQRLLAFPKSSLHRVVKTLSKMNYLRYDEQSRRYYLGTRVLSLGFSLLQSMELREVARPYLEKLSRECNKTVNLAIFDKEEMVYVERIRVPSLRDYNLFVSSVGNRIPVWNTAVGRAFLAHVEAPKLKEIMQKIGKSHEFKMTKEALLRILKEVKKDQFAVNDQEYLKGIRAIGVPVFSSARVACAINIVVEADEVTVEELRTRYAPVLLKAGEELSGALAYRG